MPRSAPGIRVLGLVFLLFSLFEPLTLTTTFAEEAPPPPNETLLESTPPSDPVPEPTVEILPTEPAPEPTLEPTEPPAPEPTAEPTLPPTEVPTVEPTVAPTIPPTEVPTAAPTETPEPTVLPTNVPSTPDLSAQSADVGIQAANVTINKVADEEQMPFGGVPGFTITATNEGDAPATDVAFEDYLPDRGGLSWVLRPQFENCVLDLNNDELLQCSGIDLEPGADFAVRVTSSYEYSADCDTTLESTARLTSGGAGEATASIYVVCPDLAITILPDADEVTAGDDLGVTIRISNASDFDAEEIVVFGWPPDAPGLAWSATGPGCFINSAAELNCYYKTIPAGGSLDVRLTSPTTVESCDAYDLSAEIIRPDAVDASHSATITVTCPEPDMTITRSIEPVFARIGDEVTLTYNVTNTGEVPLEDVYVTDYLLGTVDSCSRDVLPPEGEGEHTYQCTATTTVEAQPEREGIFKSDWANVKGYYDGAEVTASAGSVSAIVEPDSVDTITVTADPDEAVADDAVSFTITVANTGEVTSGTYGMQDRLPAVGGNDPAWEITSSDFGDLCAIATEDDGHFLDCFVEPLAPGESRSITVEHPTSFASCGEIANTATLYLANGETHASDSASVTVLCPELAFNLSAEPVAGTDVREGDEITYTFTVTNTGAVPLTNVSVESDIAGLADEPVGDLDVDGSVTLTASHTVTADDVAAGQVSRSASATGEASTGAGTAPTDPVTLTHPVVQSPSIELDIDAELQAPDDTSPLGAIDYTLTVTNTGDSTLTGIAITAPLLDDEPIPVDDLGPGRDAIINATYVLSQADIDTGSVTNEASVGGMPPAGPSGVRDYASATVELEQEAGLAVVMTADADEVAEGDEITFSFEVTNTGTVTIREITITSTLADLVWGADATSRSGVLTFAQTQADGIVGDLGPGESRTLTATYTVTGADVASGEIVIGATVTGISMDGEVTATADPVTIAVTHPEPEPEPTPEPTVPPTPEPTVPPTPEPTVPPTDEPGEAPTSPVATPEPDGTTVRVSSLPSVGSGPGGQNSVVMLALLAAALLAAGGLLAHRQRG